MSTAFTSPADASWQDLLDEITLAYSERRQVIGQEAYTPEDDKDVQAASYWIALQDWLETNCVSFIDHDNGPLTDDEDDFLYFTLDNWRAAAGLNANGFRRKYGTKGALEEAYGQMQAGDAIGPWIFEDLQKGFGALKWNVKYASSKDAYTKGVAPMEYYGTCDETRSLVISQYYASGTLDPFGYFYSALALGINIGDYAYFYRASRSSGTAYVAVSFSPVVPYSCDFYGMAADHGEIFYDGDGLGLVKDKLFFCGTVAESQSSTCELACSFGNLNVEPFTPFGVVCPITNEDWFANAAIIDFAHGGGALFKWNFTNA